MRLKDYDGLKSKSRAILPYITGKTFADIVDVADDIKTQKLKPATINRRLALLRRLGNLAFEWGWIDYPAGKKVKLLPENNERHFYLSAEQIEALAKLCPHAGDTIRLAAYTGLRRSELLRLTKDNYKDGWIRLDANTKTNRPRAVPVPKKVKRIADNLPLKVTDHVLRVEFEAARKALKMDWLHFHDLRHSYASLLADSGANLRTIGELLGHSTPTMTARYSHLSGGHLEAAVNDMTRHISRHKKKRGGAK
jgi:integrase